ncbi:MAG: hypothetical protein ABSE95_19415 [Thermodesulfobacteriota bacterium]|jgi:hypothetical protein
METTTQVLGLEEVPATSAKISLEKFNPVRDLVAFIGLAPK